MFCYLRIPLFFILLLFLPLSSKGNLTMQPSLNGMSRNHAGWESSFANPPARWCNHVIYGMGALTKDIVRRDFDSICARGFKSVMLEPGYHMPYAYLSEGYFDMVADVVREARRRGLKVWMIDEGKYPSGFAGGNFSSLRPDLRMQNLVVTFRKDVHAGATDHLFDVGKRTRSVVAVNHSGHASRMLPVDGGAVDFNPGMDRWTLVGVGGDFRTGQTRCVNDPSGSKTTKNAQMDYLNPDAVSQFLNWTHDQYARKLGKELGTTVLGFRGDEPDFPGLPWTPSLPDSFMRWKGYDPTPWLATLAVPSVSLRAQLFRADYYDVWSRMFANTYFQGEAAWCARHGVEHITHLNNDHNMVACVKSEGDPFRCLSKVQVPGVDAIWNQIWPDTVNDFPKLASSVAHVYGRHRAFSESFAAYYNQPTIAEAKYVLDYQMARGINFFELMFWMSGSRSQGWMSQPGMKALNNYLNRATWLMQQGRAGARVALYYPISTLWAGRNGVAAQVKHVARLLMQHQCDFDFVTDDMLADSLSVQQGKLCNSVGQSYETLVVPQTDMIGERAWNKVAVFMRQGGRVLFWGGIPRWKAGRSMLDSLHAFVMPETACYEPSGEFTQVVASALPRAEIVVENVEGLVPDTRPRRPGDPRRQPVNPLVSLSYTRRVMKEGSLVMLFNEGRSTLHFRAGLDGVGSLQIFDAETGNVCGMPSRVNNNRTWVELTMKPWQTVFIRLVSGRKLLSSSSIGVIADGKVLNTHVLQQAIDSLYANGGGTLVIDRGVVLTGALFFPCGVNLHVSRGAVLLGSTQAADYPLVPTRFEGVERVWKPALLNFSNGSHVVADGQGVIDGQGDLWRSMPFSSTGRPRLLCFTQCSDVNISGLTLRNQASWGLHILYSRGVRVSGLNITADHHIPSSDGIDIDSSLGVCVDHCRIDCNDDCVSIKSGRDEEGRRLARPSEDIVVSHCYFGYGHSGVAIGSELSGNVRNVMVSDCVAGPGNEHAIRVKSQPGRGGVVDHITFRNLQLDGANHVFDILMRWRMKGATGGRAPQLTQVKDLLVDGLHGTCQSLGTISGDPESPLGGITLVNCKVDFQQPLAISHAHVTGSIQPVTR